MSIELVTILMFGSLFFLLLAGLPVAWACGGLAAVFIYFLLGPEHLALIAVRTYGQMAQYLLFAIPLFIFMGSMLEKTGIIDEMFEMCRRWAGPLPGALATATVITSTLLAACLGVIGAAVVAMGLIALPVMLKRKYNQYIACGSVMAGGTLGILIPPSVLSIVYGLVAGESVGKLFAGGILPGLVLSSLFVIYITIRCVLNKELGPPLTKEERAEITWKMKFMGLLSIAFPLALIIGVMGSIFFGVTSITEAGAVGAFGACVAGLLKRRFTWENLKVTSYQTVKATLMVLWTMFGALALVTFYLHFGGAEFVSELIFGLELGRYGTLALIMVILITLGMFVDWVGIIYLAVPLFLPIIKELGFDPLWFGIIYNVNMQMSFLSPPFGYALFYLRGVVPPEITMWTIIKSAFPFLGLQLLGLIICIAFPQISLVLPNWLFAPGRFLH
ncbi:MAG: C4-dicarboxylate TRAP transporter large permease protein DctM [Syntrophomonadaceae bacterium]|nr:C4-dicarboxylate TRAP transporter large permease protein DctM [Bacillota bacterium]